MKKHSAKVEPPKFDAEGYQIGMDDVNGEALPAKEAGFRPFAHGGARKGAGRKPSGNKPVLLRLSPAAVAVLRARAESESKTLSEVAEECIAAS